jgi:hypothetical protein
MDRYQPLLFQPVPSVLGFSVTEMLEEVRAAHFPDLLESVEARFVANGPLASLHPNFMGRDRHLVVFHPVLNHPGTPREVLRFICKHELTHVARPPRVVCGAWAMHPPEFWEHEAAVGPERFAAWAWIHQNLRGCTRQTSRGFTVHRAWHRVVNGSRTPYTPTLPFNGERWDRACPGAGSQMLFPPDWAPRPLPLGAGFAPQMFDQLVTRSRFDRIDPITACARYWPPATVKWMPSAARHVT